MWSWTCHLILCISEKLEADKQWDPPAGGPSCPEVVKVKMQNQSHFWGTWDFQHQCHKVGQDGIFHERHIKMQICHLDKTRYKATWQRVILM